MNVTAKFLIFIANLSACPCFSFVIEALAVANKVSDFRVTVKMPQFGMWNIKQWTRDIILLMLINSYFICLAIFPLS